MGFSGVHASDVPLILNLNSGAITPHYHLVIYDLFSTVPSIRGVSENVEENVPNHWKQLCLEFSILFLLITPLYHFKLIG